jgi:hypothetical protein
MFSNVLFLSKIIFVLFFLFTDMFVYSHTHPDELIKNLLSKSDDNSLVCALFSW